MSDMVGTWMGNCLSGLTTSVCTNHPGQLSFMPSEVYKTSTSQTAMMLWGWGTNAGMAHSTCEYMCGWQGKLRDPSLACAIPDSSQDKSLVIKHHTNLQFTLLSYLLAVVLITLARKVIKKLNRKDSSHFQPSICFSNAAKSERLRTGLHLGSFISSRSSATVNAACNGPRRPTR